MRNNVRETPPLVEFSRTFIRRGKPKHRKGNKVWSLIGTFSVLLSSIGLVAISGMPAGATISTAAQPDVAGSNTTVTVAGNPIREGATVAGGTTIGIGTSALLNPGIGAREIRTKYNANTVYQAGTARAPEGWTLYYSTNNGSTWSTTEPTPASGVTDIKATASSVAAGAIDGYSQQYSTETSASIPSSTFSASTGGDGWGVAFYDDYIFNVYHHANSTVLECKRKSTGLACATATTTITTTEGATVINYMASNRSDLAVDSTAGRLYAITAPTAGTNQYKAGILCIDVRATPTACGFTPLTTRNAVTSYDKITDISKAANRYFGIAIAGQPELICFDSTTNAACANSPISLPGVTSSYAGRTRVIADKIFVKTDAKLFCYKHADLSVCDGSWPKTVTHSKTPSTMSDSGDYDIVEHNSTTGVSDGVCVFEYCFNFAGVSQNWTNPWSVLTGGQYPVYMRSVTTVGRMYTSLYPTNKVKCFDFATNAACTNWFEQGGGLIYQVTVDPENPACLWFNSDF